MAIILLKFTLCESGCDTFDIAMSN
jgi:hypothetical protein